MPIKSAHWSFTDNGDGTTDHFLLAPEGTRSDIPVFAKDSAGNVTGLVGADGIAPIVHCPIRLGTPIGIAPSGTVGVNGLLTLGTALLTVPDSIYLYFPANAVTPGSAAGFYWCDMLSTVVGAVYADRFMSALGEMPTKPATPTATPGHPTDTAYTGIGADITNAVQLVFPGGILGKNGAAQLYMQSMNNSSANNKGCTVLFGAQYIAGSTTLTTNTHAKSISQVHNKGSETDNLVSWGLASFSVLNAAETHIDTTQNVKVEVRLSCSAGTDWTMLSGLYVTVLPGD